VSEYVVDASVVINALGRKDAAATTVRRKIQDAVCHAPHLIDAEVGQVLRRGVHIGEIQEEAAITALTALPEIVDHRYPQAGQLASQAWKLRHRITFYDGLYVALAMVLDLPLLTSDRKLSKAGNLPCHVSVI
jgi:predicted nucleic acid-binding protein